MNKHESLSQDKQWVPGAVFHEHPGTLAFVAKMAHIGTVLKKRKKSIWVCLKIGYTPNYSHLIGIINDH